MSKGSPKIVFRLPEETLEKLMVIIDKANERVSHEPYTISSWVRKAIMEKVSHLDRTVGTIDIAVVDCRLEEMDQLSVGKKKDLKNLPKKKV